MKRRTVTVAIVLIAMSWPTGVCAQEVPSPIFTVLSATDVIAEAEIIAVHSRWRGGFIVSEVTVEIVECVHGQCPSQVASFEVAGGEIDGIVQVISGSRVPREGQEIVLLLVQTPSSSAELIAHLPVVIDGTGQRLVTLAQARIQVDELRHLVLNAGGN